MKKLLKYILLMVLAVGSWSCSKEFLEPTVSTDKDVETSINSVKDLQALIVGAYDKMNESDYYGRDFVIFGEVRSDNAFSNGNSGRYVGPGQFFLNSTDAYPTDTWQRIYQVVSVANIIINAEITVLDSEKDTYNHVVGQAYATRALAYFDLLRLYGQEYTGGSLGVPLITEFKNPDDLYPERSTITEVYSQITSDLTNSKSMLVPSLDGDATEITSMFVSALESRVYLYMKDYAKAEQSALEVINSGQYSLGGNSWGPNLSSGSIFELAFTPSDNLGNTCLYYIVQNTVYGDIEATTDLYNSFEASDVRRNQFTFDGSSTYRTGKYDDPAYLDGVRVIRYAEVLLNYAEALTMQNDPGALAALNVIPNARGATPYATANLTNVLNERRKELEFEGHRYYDLMRNGMDIVKVDPRQTFPDSGIPFGSPELTFPIPNDEVNANPNMVQNTDY